MNIFNLDTLHHDFGPLWRGITNIQWNKTIITFWSLCSSVGKHVWNNFQYITAQCTNMAKSDIRTKKITLPAIHNPATDKITWWWCVRSPNIFLPSCGFNESSLNVQFQKSWALQERWVIYLPWHVWQLLEQCSIHISIISRGVGILQQT